MNTRPDLIELALQRPHAAIAYAAGVRLRDLFRNKVVVECAACGFDLDGFVEAGHATLTPLSDLGPSQFVTAWRGCNTGERGNVCGADETGITRRVANAFVRLTWQVIEYSSPIRATSGYW